MKPKLKIQILVDNPNSWYHKYVGVLINALRRNHSVALLRDYKEIKEGDLVFILSCDKIIPNEVLKLNKHNLVVHGSAVPKGKGWSPLTWQILEGKNKIPISLFEATSKVDSGDVYLEDYLNFDGTELVDELREVQAMKTYSLIMDFVEKYPNIIGKKQAGSSTYYPKRTPRDSRLDINKTITEQFNLFRVVDNEQYPAFFEYKGCKYVLSIKKEHDEK